MSAGKRRDGALAGLRAPGGPSRVGAHNWRCYQGPQANISTLATTPPHPHALLPPRAREGESHGSHRRGQSAAAG